MLRDHIVKQYSSEGKSLSGVGVRGASRRTWWNKRNNIFFAASYMYALCTLHKLNMYIVGCTQQISRA